MPYFWSDTECKILFQIVPIIGGKRYFSEIGGCIFDLSSDTQTSLTCSPDCVSFLKWFTRRSYSPLLDPTRSLLLPTVVIAEACELELMMFCTEYWSSSSALAINSLTYSLKNTKCTVETLVSRSGEHSSNTLCWKPFNFDPELTPVLQSSCRKNHSRITFLSWSRSPSEIGFSSCVPSLLLGAVSNACNTTSIPPWTSTISASSFLCTAASTEETASGLLMNTIQVTSVVYRLYGIWIQLLNLTSVVLVRVRLASEHLQASMQHQLQPDLHKLQSQFTWANSWYEIWFTRLWSSVWVISFYMLFHFDVYWL